jgi:integrase
MAAVDDELIAKNPCSARSVSQPRAVARRVVPWNLDQVMAVRAGLAVRYRSMVDLASGCGLRQGEVFGLAEEDVDFDGGWVEVQRQVKKIKGRLAFGLPKSDRPRRVPLPGSVGKLLQAHLIEFPPRAVTLPWEDPSSGDPTTVRLVFTSPRGGAINRSTFDERSWHAALAAAAIVPSRSTGMHALRHFYASALLDAGENVKALSEYLGHADPGFTLRVYTHLMPSSEDRTRRAIDALHERWDGPQTAQGS